MTCPSVDADNRVLNERETARTVTGERWPNKVPAGCRSTDLLPDVYVQIDTVQSLPAVTNVRESAKMAQDS